MTFQDNDDLPEVEIPKKDNKKLWIAFFICFATSVITSSGVMYFFVQSAKTDLAANNQINEKNPLLLSLQASITEQNKTLANIEAESNVLKRYLRHSSATALKNILINQEQNIQEYLNVTRSAIGDLSTIIPRTTDWNIKYQYQLDLAQKSSLEREDLLKLLKTGEPNEKAHAED